MWVSGSQWVSLWRLFPTTFSYFTFELFNGKTIKPCTKIQSTGIFCDLLSEGNTTFLTTLYPLSPEKSQSSMQSSKLKCCTHANTSLIFFLLEMGACNFGVPIHCTAAQLCAKRTRHFKLNVTGVSENRYKSTNDWKLSLCNIKRSYYAPISNNISKRKQSQKQSFLWRMQYASVETGGRRAGGKTRHLSFTTYHSTPLTQPERHEKSNLFRYKQMKQHQFPSQLY